MAISDMNHFTVLTTIWKQHDGFTSAFSVSRMAIGRTWVFPAPGFISASARCYMSLPVAPCRIRRAGCWITWRLAPTICPLPLLP